MSKLQLEHVHWRSMESDTWLWQVFGELGQASAGLPEGPLHAIAALYRRFCPACVCSTILGCGRCAASLGKPVLAFLRDHCVHGRALAAGTAFLEAALGATAMVAEHSSAELLGLARVAFVGALILPAMAQPPRCVLEWVVSAGVPANAQRGSVQSIDCAGAVKGLPCCKDIDLSIVLVQAAASA